MRTNINLIVLTLTLLLYGIDICGQASEESQDSTIYITEKDEALLIDKDVKLVFKTPISLEIKVGKAFSLIPSVGFEFGNDIDSSGIRTNLHLETRYYYLMAKKIEAGEQASNISGKYLSTTVTSGIQEKLRNTRRLRLNYGIQQRILNKEYIDIGIRLEYKEEFSTLIAGERISSIGLNTFVNYGFIIGKKHQIDPAKACSLIGCYTNRKSAWKLGLDNFISITRRFDIKGIPPFWLFSFNPKINYEHKIGNSSFSIEQELEGSIRFGFENLNPALNLLFSKTFNSSFTYLAGSKFYYKMAKEILEGKSGNNLWGSFLFVRAKHVQFSNNQDGFIQFGIGKQRELFDKFLFEYAIFGNARTYGKRAGFDIDSEPIGIDFKFSYLLN